MQHIDITYYNRFNLLTHWSRKPNNKSFLQWKCQTRRPVIRATTAAKTTTPITAPILPNPFFFSSFLLSDAGRNWTDVSQSLSWKAQTNLYKLKENQNWTDSGDEKNVAVFSARFQPSEVVATDRNPCQRDTILLRDGSVCGSKSECDLSTLDSFNVGPELKREFSAQSRPGGSSWVLRPSGGGSTKVSPRKILPNLLGVNYSHISSGNKFLYAHGCLVVSILSDSD